MLEFRWLGILMVIPTLTIAGVIVFITRKTEDVFLNLAGGIRVEDPGIDLAVVCGILSSSEDIPINSKFCFAAEVGLSGEIRPVSRIDQRISEAEKLGFERIYISKFNKLASVPRQKIQVMTFGKLAEVLEDLFG